MKKRFLSILAALCLCLTLLPATAMAESDSIDQAKFFVDSWGDLRDTLTNSTEAVINAQLTQGITWEKGSIVIPEGKTVTLDLNGCKIDAQNQGTAIQVYGTIKTDEPRTLDFSWVRGFLVTNVYIVQRSAA